MRRLRSLAGVVVSLAAAGGVAACGSGETLRGAELRGDFTLAQARAFEEFPLVWAGEGVEGLPLVAIVRRDDTARYVSFVYGDCHPASFDSGCAPPAEIQVWPADMRNLASYDSPVPVVLTPEQTRIRGSPAAFLDDGTRLEIYTELSTVVVFAHSQRRVLVIAQALRCLTKGGAEGSPHALDC